MDSDTPAAQLALERLREAAGDGTIDQICGRLGVTVFGAFGSAARGEAARDSDLDICVSFSAEPAELELIDELVKLTDFDRIDLAVIDGASPVLRARAMTGVDLFEDEPGRYALTQMAALGEYRDTTHLRELEIRALAQ